MPMAIMVSRRVKPSCLRRVLLRFMSRSLFLPTDAAAGIGVSANSSCTAHDGDGAGADDLIEDANENRPVNDVGPCSIGECSGGIELHDRRTAVNRWIAD